MNHRADLAHFFVYQAYGKIEILQQTMFSLVSLLAFVRKQGDCGIVIYTDQKSYFTERLGDLPFVFYEELTPEKIAQWRGSIQFVHRLKIEMLLDTVQKYPGRLIYLDGDTYFLTDPGKLFEKIDEKNTLMHLPEGRVSGLRDPLSKKLTKFLRRESFVLDGKPYKILPEMTMWNAGVIGYASFHEGLLKDVLSLTDQSYGKYQKHVMEQMAVSEVLQKNSNVHRTDETIYHYWNQKDEYQRRIVEFLGKNNSVNELIENYGKFEFPQAPQPKLTLWKKLKMWLDSR